VVLWGRSLGEYAKMLALTPIGHQGRILDCGAGRPASFNAAATEVGHRVGSGDPLYRFSADAIRRRVEETADTLLASVREHTDRFVWRQLESPERLREIRLSAMHRFLEDLPAGLDHGRYRTQMRSPIPASGTTRSTSPSARTRSLCLYSDALSLELHLTAVEEMAR
jgi:hypothetical protein